MLNVLRRNAGSWFIKAILSFIALTFIIWGVGNYGTKDPYVAAVIGKESISMAEFAEAAETLEKSYKEAYGQMFTPEVAQALGLKKQAINMLIRQKIMLAEAEKMGIRATNDEVQQEIASMPDFQVNGKFHSEMYRQLLAQNRMDPSQFESATRTKIIHNKLSDVLAYGASITEPEAKYLFLLSARKIRVLAVAAEPAKMKNLPAPSQEEIEAKYEQVKESFRIPARVKLAVANFTPDHFARGINPSEEEIKAYYDENTNQFLTEEQRLVSRIFIPYTPQNKEDLLEKASQALMEAAKGTAGFEAVAKKLRVSRTAEAWVTRADVPSAMATALFQAPADTIIGPMDQGGAFTLAHVSRIQFPEMIPLAQARNSVAEQIRMRKGKDLATIKAYEAHPQAVVLKDIDKALVTHGIKASKTGWLGEEVSTEASTQIVQDALMLSVGEVGPIKTIGDIHYLYQVLEKEDSRIPPLDHIRPQILALVTKDQQTAAARAAAQKVLSESKTASELEANAKKAGLLLENTGWFAPLVENLPWTLTQVTDTYIRKDLALLSPQSLLIQKIYETPGGVNIAVAFLEEQIASEADWATSKNYFIQGIQEQNRKNLIDGFIVDRMKQYKVEIMQEDLK
ncbi:MAG: SurA N-terminal domain-containing protein [Syntrophorhabdaceae bacterium]|nr:SurA N-terminal domain-containing protein [Syntrophorhabdaceae bacterium]